MNYINWTFLLSILILVVSYLIYLKDKKGRVHTWIGDIRKKLNLNEYYRKLSSNSAGKVTYP
jgi:hypothetical protein